MYIYIIDDHECRRVTGVPETVPDQLGSCLRDVQRVLYYYIHGDILHKVFAQIETWCARTPAIGGNRKLAQAHEAERLCRAFLYEFRTCLDHIETDLKRAYGDESAEWKRYERLTNVAYDTHPEYGFTYHLRNCAQHCINIVHGYNGAEGPGLSASRTVLLAGYTEWKEYDKQYMAAAGEDIDLLSLFRKALAAYDTVLRATIQWLLDENDAARKLVHIKEWGDELTQSLSCDVNDLYLVELRHSDGSVAAAEELAGQAPGISLDAQLIEWDAIYGIVGKLKAVPREA